MKVETREDALLHCFDLWLWLALNPSEYKRSWPGWKKNGGYLDECLHNCPCCEYASWCRRCPINWSIKSDLFNPCESSDSMYENWKKSSNLKDKSKHALEIATLALEALFKE